MYAQLRQLTYYSDTTVQYNKHTNVLPKFCQGKVNLLPFILTVVAVVLIIALTGLVLAGSAHNDNNYSTSKVD